MVRADRPIDGSIQLSLQGAEGMTNSTFLVQVTSTGEPIGTSGESLPTGGIFIGLLIVILLAAGAFIVQRQKPNHDSPMPIPYQVPAANFKPVPVLSTSEPDASAPMCWSCRKPISGLMLGCPGCGARYHRSGQENCSASELDQCLNCPTPSTSFVEA
jgi:hypothetical protein